ncbi:hypothetical protein WJX73_010048 [Symbiochloris irregularis]|uniref:Probable RNA polymerase II nuclear localization protein SLC7A6OS n=1 Tax=Symbiochloris irregularis TaxID=706552 RepID=A0AAW1PGD6_9CHLO
MEFDQQQGDGPATVLRVKRKRTTPSAPELVVEGLVPRAAKRQAILNHFSQLGLGEAAKSEESLLHRQAARELDNSAAYNASSVTYQHIVEDRERDSLSKLFQIYTIAAEMREADSRPIDERPTAEQGDLRDHDSIIAEALSTDEVYDYYMLSTEAHASADWDLHVSRLPMVKIQDDLWLVDEDEVNEDHDSEDSNAESFYANSYPEDEDGSQPDQSRGGCFSVKFGRVTKTLSREQLERAPDSLVSAALLATTTGDTTSTLEIPSQASQGAAPGFARWNKGTEDLFQVCMDCYVEESEEGQEERFCKVLPAPAMISALDFFNIPQERWPVGVQMAKKTLQMRKGYQKHLRNLMKQCIGMLSSEVLSRTSPGSLYNKADPRAAFVFTQGSVAVDMSVKRIECDIQGKVAVASRAGAVHFSKTTRDLLAKYGQAQQSLAK